jgi:hypothetical protein
MSSAVEFSRLRADFRKLDKRVALLEAALVVFAAEVGQDAEGFPEPQRGKVKAVRAILGLRASDGGRE